MREPVIEAWGLSKRFLLRHNRAESLKVRVLGLLYPGQREVVEEFWALRDISLSIGRGEAVGLVGRNGSGKSTLLKLIAGIHRPTRGKLLLRRNARIGTMIELGIGFHPDLSGTENVYLNAAIHGLSRSDIDAIYPQIVEYSGLRHFMDVPLKNYSSGMNMRLGFAIAANLDPDILLLDEIFAVGDEDFQKQCMRTMARFSAEGRTLLFVSHAPAAVRSICRRVCVLDEGRLQFDGEVEAGLAEYQRIMIDRPRVDPGARRDNAGAPASAEGDGTAGEQDDGTRDWTLEFLKGEGLQPQHRVLEVTCGTWVGSSALARYVGRDRYQHWEINSPLGEPLRPFDYAIASPLLSRVSLNAAARCIAIAMQVMRNGARLYATWLEDPDPVTVPDAPPFHYPYKVLANLGAALGADVARVGGHVQPEDEAALVIIRIRP